MSSLHVVLTLTAIAFVVAIGVFVVRTRARRRARRPAREPTSFVILQDNLWDVCTVDDVREPWARYTTEPVRGFCGVPAGRHRVTTRTSSGEAVLDFVAYPGEVLAWRLDLAHARWEPHDLDAETSAALETMPASNADGGSRAKLPGWLVHLRTTMRVASSRSGASLRSSEEAVERLAKRLAKLVGEQTDARGDAGNADRLSEARALGESIIGRPLTRAQLRALVAPVRETAARLAGAGDPERAMFVLALGLAVLPGDPELMVTAGCTLAARGENDEALRALNAALERDRCLAAEDVARAMRARMELRSRLGRSVHA